MLKIVSGSDDSSEEEESEEKNNKRKIEEIFTSKKKQKYDYSEKNIKTPLKQNSSIKVNSILII
jgi:hypothetical protein